MRALYVLEFLIIIKKKNPFKIYLIVNEIHKPQCLFHVYAYLYISVRDMRELKTLKTYLLLALQFVYNIYYFYTKL